MKRSIITIIASALLLTGCVSDRIGVQKDEWVLLEVNPSLLEPVAPMVVIEQPKPKETVKKTEVAK